MKKIIKKMRKQALCGLLCLSLLVQPVFLLPVQAVEEPKQLYARAAVLMDADSGRVLYSKDGETTYPMASTTKIMTCILALELESMDSIVTFSDYAASMPDVQMNAKAGEQYYLKDLLYSIMLESHNDSAAAVAETVGGSVEGFTRLMNQKADAIGCTGTHFVTPNGLDGEDEGGTHGSTAKDLALILRYCIAVSAKAPEFLKITGTESHSFSEIQGKRYVNCQNHNALLQNYRGALTGKTGFTGSAGYCYVGAAKQGERTLIISLLGAGWYPNRSYKWKDAKKLLDYGFENYSYQILGKESWDLPKIRVVNGMEETTGLMTDAEEFSYLLGEGERVECKVDLPKSLMAPVEKGTVVGTIRYELDGATIEQFQIVTIQEVEKATICKKIIKFLANLVDNVWKWLDLNS